MVGVAGLESNAQALAAQGSHAAQVYYWIGEQYQRQGYGTQALTLLHQWAGKLGVLHLFATVDRDNAASRRTLARLGYAQLPIRVSGERRGSQTHYVGPETSESQRRSILVQLLADLHRAAIVEALEPDAKE
jgi:RimJ/RimL family protein N-acetyltransferase